MDVQPMLAAMAEPTRFRIVELLSTRAYAVGEVAAAIGALQPQTTKHIQALEAAGLVRVHKLGRRRVARLDRDAMAALSRFFDEHAASDPDDETLDEYEAAIARESSGAAGVGSRVLTFQRTLAASAERAWAAWTDPTVAAQWWAPRHFVVEAFDIGSAPDTPIRLVLREGHGPRYESAGTVVDSDPVKRLVFDLAPLDDAGAPLFDARHVVSLASEGDTTELALTITVSGVRAEAAPAVAGLGPGWTQLLDALRDVVED